MVLRLTQSSWPPLFQVFGPGPQPSTAGGAVASNDQSLHLDALDLSVPHASIGGVGLDNLAFHYAGTGDRQANCARDYWHASGQLLLGNGPTVNLVPASSSPRHRRRTGWRSVPAP